MEFLQSGQVLLRSSQFSIHSIQNIWLQSVIENNFSFLHKVFKQIEH